MGLVVQTASGQCIRNSSPPVTNYPFTIAMWTYPFTANTQVTMWSLQPTSGTADLFTLFKSSAGAWALNATRSTSTNASIASAVTANAWQFVLGRFIASGNRRLSVIKSDGGAVHAQDTTGKSPANLVKEEIGAASNANFYDGIIAEYWKTSTDIQADGGQIDEGLLRTIAYRGPFAAPHVAKDIVEYRSFRQGLSSDEDEIGEVYHGSFGRQTWAKVQGASPDLGPPFVGAHPPLFSSYASWIPKQVRDFGVVYPLSPASSTIKFRRTLSQLGARMGGRQRVLG